MILFLVKYRKTVLLGWKPSMCSKGHTAQSFIESQNPLVRSAMEETWLAAGIDQLLEDGVVEDVSHHVVVQNSIII